MKTLDIEAVQAFVLTADLKSFTRAAEAMDTTQSAVSLKIKSWRTASDDACWNARRGRFACQPTAPRSSNPRASSWPLTRARSVHSASASGGW